MSHLKRPKTHIPIPGGDFDGGVYSEEFHILDSGAAGAFVHGLEDEFQELESLTKKPPIHLLDSIALLSKDNIEFAKKSIDFLVGMFLFKLL
ncbi:Integrator complex subunit 4-like protein [Smittium culicis]|uniref:Integrator complex subunit 4-like protein n=1 Tax=Smittium culicis TaxID=133412 RepID=A0A1R1XQI6_9FUNG|nr:Integrator complex subunit 4-like protein [Smittium culicis]